MPIDAARSQISRRLPLGLLGAMVLIFLVEQSIETNAIDSQGGNHWSYRVAARVAGNEVRTNQILCFGDSLLRLGLAPRVIEAETGLRGYNFAQAGGQAPSSYFLLRAAVESGAKPAAIVVEFFPNLLTQTTKLNDQNWPFLARLTDGLRFSTFNGDLEAFGHFAVSRLLPSIRSRTSLRTAIQLGFQTEQRIIKGEILKAIRNWKTNRGAEITISMPATESDFTLNGWEQAYFQPFHCLPIHQYYLERFLDLAAQHQIPVYWLLPPYRPDMQARCVRSGFDRDHTAFVRQFQARYPEVTILDARQAHYPASVFHDPHHLGLEGTAVMSADVGQMLRQSLDASGSQNRWIALPAYRSRPITAPLETTDASRVAVAKAIRQGRVGELLR